MSLICPCVSRGLVGHCSFERITVSTVLFWRLIRALTVLNAPYAHTHTYALPVIALCCCELSQLAAVCSPDESRTGGLFVSHSVF